METENQANEEKKEKKSLLFSFNLKGCLLVLLNLIVVGGVGVGLIWFGLNKVLPDTTRHGQEIKVPDVENMYVEDAISLLEENKLRYEISDTSYSAKHNPGEVIVQIPKKNALVKEDRRIYLTINVEDVPTIVIADDMKIMDVDLNTAQNNLRKLKLQFAGSQRIESKYLDYVHACLINGDTVKIGDKIPLGSSITLLVGDGKGTDVEIDSTMNEINNLIELPR